MVNRNSTFIYFWKMFPSTRLKQDLHVYSILDIFSYLHVIRTPRLLESSEYLPVISRQFHQFCNYLLTNLQFFFIENECCYLHQQCYIRKNTHPVFCKKFVDSQTENSLKHVVSSLLNQSQCLFTNLLQKLLKWSEAFS